MRVSVWTYLNCICIIIVGLNILTIDPTLPPMQMDTYLMWNGIAMLCSIVAILIFVIGEDLNAKKGD